jgi:hypothetical protein
VLFVGCGRAIPALSNLPTPSMTKKNVIPSVSEESQKMSMILFYILVRLTTLIYLYLNLN